MADSYDELLKRAKDGDAEAMLFLGRMYYKGDGITVNKAKAKEWWEKAAVLGHAEAMYNLGRMYYKGAGGTLEKQYRRAPRVLRERRRRRTAEQVCLFCVVQQGT